MIQNRAKASPFATRGGRYEIRTAAKNDTADVFLYDEIGFWGVQAGQFVKDLNAIDAKTINVRINSPGGDVFDGSAIYNALKSHDAEIITHIDGLAASYASVIAMAGNEIRMAKNAFLMIHNPWTLAIGDATEMRKQAALLDKIGGVITKNYADQTGKPVDEMQSLMDAETWFTADEALAIGLIDAVEDEEDDDTNASAAMFDLSIFTRAPKQLQNSQNLSRAMPDKGSLEAILRDAGCSRKQAQTLLSKGYDAAHPSDSSAGDAAIASIAAAIEDTTRKIKQLTP